jgi:hypothetical protein
MIVGRSEVIIGLASDPEDFPIQKAFIDPLHITRVEPINGKKPKSNGRKARN